MADLLPRLCRRGPVYPVKFSWLNISTGGEVKGEKPMKIDNRAPPSLAVRDRSLIVIMCHGVDHDTPVNKQNKRISAY